MTDRDPRVPAAWRAALVLTMLLGVLAATPSQPAPSLPVSPPDASAICRAAMIPSLVYRVIHDARVGESLLAEGYAYRTVRRASVLGPLGRRAGLEYSCSFEADSLRPTAASVVVHQL